MRKRPSIDTTLARRRSLINKNSVIQGKSPLTAPDIPFFLQEPPSPHSAIVVSKLKMRRKPHCKVTGVISPASCEVDKDDNAVQSAKVSKVLFKFPEKQVMNSELVIEKGVEVDGKKGEKEVIGKSCGDGLGLSEISEFLISARESLYSLRHEAKIYMSSSKKYINDVQKSRRSSFVSDEFKYFTSFCQSEAQDPMKELSESIEDLKAKISQNEKTKSQLISTDSGLKEAVQSLEKNIQVYQDLKTQNKASNCTSNCLLF